MPKSLESRHPLCYCEAGGDEMIRKLSCKIADYCTDGTEADREIVAYGLECRISDFTQIAVLLICGLVFRHMVEMLCFCVCFTALKRQVGGFHCSTHLSCIGFFSILAVCASELAARIPSGSAVCMSLVSMAAALCLVVLRAPIAHPNHPKSKAAHQKSRKASLWLAALGAILLPLLSVRHPAQGTAGAWGGLLAALSLVIPVKKERRSNL